ncbi:hypothetical protein Y1Q_0001441 [Alligator mississippiensis]|uniref:Uncharacterized protein n=1 Tax=Alligator mississippiensis TaxID=8496 RepID=A0A151M9G0_ALLMI|nr:hypothetical protein Y1Q_0001441 [Alligator mississippiensis]
MAIGSTSCPLSAEVCQHAMKPKGGEKAKESRKGKNFNHFSEKGACEMRGYCNAVKSVTLCDLALMKHGTKQHLALLQSLDLTFRTSHNLILHLQKQSPKRSKLFKAHM